MVIANGLSYEASMTHGCRVVPVEIAMEGIKSFQDMYIPVPNIKSCLDFGEQQNGKPYDWSGAFGIPFLMSDDWADSSKWWCSELVFAMLGNGGIWLLDPEEMHRVTPADIHKCNFQKSPVFINS